MEYGSLDRCPAGRTRERAFAVLRKHTRHTGTANLLYYPFLTPPPPKNLHLLNGCNSLLCHTLSDLLLIILFP